MATDKEVEALRNALGIGAGTLVNQRIVTAIDFFRGEVGVDPFDDKHIKYVRGIDFHRDVYVKPLERGTQLVRFPELDAGMFVPETDKPYRFLAFPGASSDRLGWNVGENGYQRFEMLYPTWGLISTASEMIFPDVRKRLENKRLGFPERLDTRVRPGGARQVVIRRTSTILDLIHKREYDRQTEHTMRLTGYLWPGASRRLTDRPK